MKHRAVKEEWDLLQRFEHNENEITYIETGQKETPIILWAHGWGQNHAAFLPLAQSFENQGRNVLVDFPGFGQSPPPSKNWGTEDYADFSAEMIRSITDKPVLWVGHSFGCRVGLQIAARHPDLIKGLFLIAGAGLPRRFPLHKKLYFKARSLIYKFLKKLIPFGLSEDWLKNKFGSADYRNAGPMRNILVKVVNEDLRDVAKNIQCPVRLVYGRNDTETPPEIGERLNTLIKNSKMVHLDGQDHYSVLGQGRHQVSPLLQNFLRETES